MSLLSFKTIQSTNPKHALISNSWLPSSFLSTSLTVISLWLCSAVAVPLFADDDTSEPVLKQAQQYTLTLGGQLPEFSVTTKGELFLKGKKVIHKPWSSHVIQGKPAIMQILIASPKAKKMNEHFIAKVEDKAYDFNQLANVNIVVSKTMPSLFRGFVTKELKKNKKKHPHAQLIEDQKADVWKALNLYEPSSITPDSLIMVIDRAGNIVYLREGVMTDPEIELFFNTVEGLLATFE